MCSVSSSKHNLKLNNGNVSYNPSRDSYGYLQLMESLVLCSSSLCRTRWGVTTTQLLGAGDEDCSSMVWQSSDYQGCKNMLDGTVPSSRVSLSQRPMWPGLTVCMCSLCIAYVILFVDCTMIAVSLFKAKETNKPAIVTNIKWSVFVTCLITKINKHTSRETDNKRHTEIFD